MPAASPRKAPQQQRSRATVDAILTATTQVLAEHGYQGATTNLIARRAGVSIGSLYQYFPNKKALVSALAEQHLQRVTERLMAQLDLARDLPLHAALRLIIEGLLAHHTKDVQAHQVFLELGPKLAGASHCRDVDRMIDQAITVHLAQRPERLRPRNLELGVFMLVRGVEAITHAAVLERPGTIEDGELARELVDMLASYLLDDTQRAQAARRAEAAS